MASEAVSAALDSNGWTSGPDGRGTFGIISSCLVTISLCCWSAVYPSVPGRSDGYWQRFRDKFGLALLTVLGPEFLLILAVGQRASARRAVRQFHAQKYECWTMEHAFFADMGGFMLMVPDYHPFPIDAAQVLYLVKRGYLDLPQITKSEIKDRDKSDGLSRLIIVFQASWFTVDLIARAIQRLAVTTLEVTTMSFIIILFATSYCWREKPSDLMCPVELKIRDGVTMQQVIDEAQLGDGYTWYRTPLDFVSRYDNVLSLTWHYYNDMARKLLFSPFSRRVKTKPWDRFPPDLFLRTELDLELWSSLFVLGFGSVFCIAWNFQFPTAAEKTLWRAASIYMVVYTVVGEAFFGLWFYLLLPRYRAATGLPDVVELDDATRRVRGLLGRLFPSTRHDGPRPSSRDGSDVEFVANEVSPKAKNRWVRLKRMMHKSVNNSPDKDPQLDVPLAFLIPTSFLCLIYVLFRGYILVEDLIGLRSLPSSAFETVSWAQFVPHI